MLADLKAAESQLLAILEQLKCKVSYDDVDVQVEGRYAEILKYLQSTLRATEADDDDVRREAAELRLALNEMRMTKADRGDLAQLRAQVATQVDDAMGATEIEDLRRDLDARPRRAELFELLTNKVSFSDLQRSIAKLEQRAPPPPAAAPPRDDDDASTLKTADASDRSTRARKHAQQVLRVPRGPEDAAATARGYGDFKRPGSAPLDTLPPRACLSCEAPLVNAAAKLKYQTKVLGAGFAVGAAPLGTLAPLEHVPDGGHDASRPLYVSAIPPPTVVPAPGAPSHAPLPHASRTLSDRGLGQTRF